MNISQFLSEDLSDYASYSTLRMLGNMIDGQKNSTRKTLFTVLDKNINKEIKVSQLASKIAEHSEYLHGEVSLQGVVVNAAQDFTGTNNINLLTPEGNFGTRFTPEASAPRYIYTHGNDNLWRLFNKNDTPILIHQEFEGHKIEPMFYVPTLPMILVNGSEGIASGFAQKILPRDPKKIMNYIKDKLNDSLRANRHNSLHPYYKGFKGNIISLGDNQYEITGIINKLTGTKIEISEIPIGYSLKGYIKVLDKLEDEGFIVSYQDLSEDDNFKFIVNIKRDILSSYTDDKLLDKLKLIKRVTENLTAINEENKVQVFDSVKDIIDQYYDVKIEYLQKRKDYLIKKLSDEIRVNISKYLFIKAITDNELIINKRKKEDIVKDLNGYPKIIQVDDSYDYLLNMNLMSLTKERMDKLMQQIKDLKAELDLIKSQSPEQMWLSDLGEIKDI